MSSEHPFPPAEFAPQKRPVETIAAHLSPRMSPRPVKVPRTEKGYKGLRHFSMMVCKKVEEKGTTSYNEVADELVDSVVRERKQKNPNGKYDEKNIRRRVYDALNVLMAMDIITKEKKEITWKGLPTGASQDVEMLEKELDFRKQQLQKKRDALKELLIQQTSFRNLVQHNHQRPAEHSEQQPQQDNKIPLPFIVVNTHSSAVIQCNMSRDLTDVMFDFSMPFEISDDNTILKRLGMHRSTLPELQEWVPGDILQYCQGHGILDEIVGKAEVTEGTISTSDYKE